MSLNVDFRGHICEVQIHLKDFFNVKKNAHKTYAVVRSLQLEGELTEVPENITIPLWVEIACMFLHLNAAFIGIGQSTLYRFYHWAGNCCVFLLLLVCDCVM